jgi:Centromere DNA-binding protein complex CBF3 subunit, domain 2
MLLRMDSVLQIELADLASINLDNCTYKYMVVHMMNSKTNKSAKKEYAAALRHRDVRQCPVGAIALELFVKLNDPACV